MISFKDYQLLHEAKVNSHMTHLQDLVFLEGVNGTRKAINFLRDARDMLRNNGSKSGALTVKWDGAPAVIAGVDPTDGKFFVAKKGIFNKNPKVYKTQDDIDADLSGELHTKFSILLPELKKLGIKGILQGDLMYTSDDLKDVTIDGEKCVTFQPNTIVYSVPVGSELYSKIKKSKVGIVFHTKYSGEDFANLSASFGEPIVKDFKQVQSVWAVDAMYENQTGRANFTPEEDTLVQKKLSDIGKLFNQVNGRIIDHIHSDQEALDLVMMYINNRVKTGTKVEPGVKIAAGFLQFVHDRYAKDIEQKKSAKGKDAAAAKRQRVLEFLTSINIAELGKIFDLSYSIDDVKGIIVGVLNRAQNIKHLLRTEHGYEVTQPEGFVSINSNGDAVKLVDRFVFAAANSSPVYLKGWNK